MQILPHQNSQVLNSIVVVAAVYVHPNNTGSHIISPLFGHYGMVLVTETGERWFIHNTKEPPKNGPVIESLQIDCE
ncbi:hypothetical protein G9A89_004242 [Geosiphon pyriformis]|nr:hypothetical protein G9A89_004242 [Geosiphon pyriformis]